MPKIQVDRVITARSVPLKDLPVGTPFRRLDQDAGIVFLRLDDSVIGNVVPLNGQHAGIRRIVPVAERVMELEVTMACKDA